MAIKQKTELVIEDVLLEELVGNKELEQDTLPVEGCKTTDDQIDEEDETVPPVKKDDDCEDADLTEEDETAPAVTKAEVPEGDAKAAAAVDVPASGGNPLVPSEPDGTVNEAEVPKGDAKAAAAVELPAPDAAIDEEDEEDDLEKVDFSADIDALNCADDSLTESFKAKAATIFEAAVKTKLREKSKALRESYQRQLDKKVSTVSASMVEQIDRYLTHIAESWVSKNAVAIDSHLRSELSENLMKGLQKVFTENYVEIPTSKRDVVSELTAKVKSLEESLSSAKTETVRLSEEVNSAKRAAILAELTEGLADTQVSKVTTLLKDVSFENETKFRSKVSTIVETYTRPAVAPKAPADTAKKSLESLTESATQTVVSDTSIDAVLQVLSRTK